MCTIKNIFIKYVKFDDIFNQYYIFRHKKNTLKKLYIKTIKCLCLYN